MSKGKVLKVGSLVRYSVPEGCTERQNLIGLVLKFRMHGGPIADREDLQTVEVMWNRRRGRLPDIFIQEWVDELDVIQNPE